MDEIIYDRIRYVLIYRSRTWNIRCRGTAWNGHINTRSFRNGSLDHDPLLYRMGVIRNILCK